MPHHAGRKALVRPRVLWSGLALALVGAGLIGLGVIVVSTTVALAGCAGLALGAGLAWYGGLGNDTRAHTSPEDEGEEVLEGDVHQGTHPSGRITDEEVRRRAAAQARDHTQALPTRRGHRPGASTAALPTGAGDGRPVAYPS